MTFRFRRIHEGMSQLEASQQYEALLKLTIDPDSGCYDESRVVDVKRVEIALDTGVVPSRAEARAEMKRKELEREHAYGPNPDACALFAALIQSDP